MKVKVCGMRSPQSIRQIGQLYPDMMGFVFYEPSPRYCDGSASRKAILDVPVEVDRVGVFVNEKVDVILDIVQLYQLSIVQLHGLESPDIAAKLKEIGLKVIKAFHIDQEFKFSETKTFEDSCDMFLFDTKSSQYGGSGKKFEWVLLNQYTDATPFLLSGGISLSDVSRICRLQHPQCIGVDVNSGFENEPGDKNVTHIKELLKFIQS